MRISSYVIPDDFENQDNVCNVWIKIDDDEYDVRIQNVEGELSTVQMSKVIAKTPVGRLSDDTIEEMRQMALEVANNIQDINSKY